MIKKILFSLLLFLGITPVLASVTPLAEVNGKYYETLEDAIAAASADDVVKLVSDVNLDNTLNINKTVNINLNGNDITATEKVFEVKGGFLTLSGKGIIKETKPNYGAVTLIGSDNPNDDKYSVVSVGKDVTLEGWSGIFITHENSKSYGVVAHIDGKINAVNDISGGTGIGVYVNGKIKDKNNHPVINITDSAEIKSTGNGLYIAGSATFNIGKAYISGLESGIGIKSGILNIDGATVICEGEDSTPTGGYNNGIKPSGTTIQIESNSGYAGGIELNISSGNFISKNSNVIYEYIGGGDSSLIYSMSISDGTFESKANKEVFSFSKSFKDIHSGFISGGKYTSNPTEYLKSGYTAAKDNNFYVVTKSTLKETISTSVTNKASNPFITTLIVLLSSIVVVILIYFNKEKLFKLLKK